MTGQSIDEIAATIRAGLAADEWAAQEAGSGRFESVDYLWETRYLIVTLPSGEIQHTTEFSADLARHIERHDPHQVLRDIAMKRLLLDLLLEEEHAPVWSDLTRRFYRCAAGAGDPCDCGRDERAAAYLTLLAQPYTEAS